MTKSRKLFGRVRALGLLLAAAAIAVADARIAVAEYPEKAVTLMVGVRPGGGTDNTARVLAQFLEPVLGRPVVVVNKPGAGGAVMLALLKTEKPDGYTLGITPSFVLTFAPLYSKTAYKHDDFTDIASVTRPQTALVGAPGKPWTDLSGMMAALKKEGRALRVAAPGPIVNLLTEAVAKKAGVPIKIIPVRGGGASAKQVLGGHVDLTLGLGWHRQYVKSGKMALLANAGARRSPEFPDVRTLKEMGYGVQLDFSFLLVGPKGLPAGVTGKLAAAVREATRNAKLEELYAKRGMKVDYLGSAAATRLVADELGEWKNVFKAAGR